MKFIPLWVLYRISDIVAPVLYHLVGYRRGIVRNNLLNSFPDKSLREIKRIERQFYRRFTDNFVESLKLLGITDGEMRHRVTFSGVDIIDRYFDEGKTIVAYFSHSANWEWATSIALWSKRFDGGEESPVFAQVYRPLRSARWDKFFLRLRSRFHTLSFKKASVFRDLLRLQRSGRASCTGFMSDQKPSHGDPGYVTTFLNQPTAMISGTEHLARRFKSPVVFMDMKRIRRGHYHVSVSEITPDASLLPPGTLTETYTRLLEANIKADPPGWLWSHNRWKNAVAGSPYTDER